MCVEYMGVVLLENAQVRSTLKQKWFKEHMLNLPTEPTPQQLVGHCRAYLLGLIGGMLMPDKSGNRVHLMYLPLLSNFDRTGQYN